MRLSQQSLFAWCYVAALSAGLAIGLLSATPSPQDDFYLYQQFIGELAHGKLNLAIPGFHGSDVLALPWYWLTGSPIAQIYSLMFLAILLPPAAFLAGKALYRSTESGVLLAGIIALMPFISFVCLRGWTGPGYWFLMLMTVFAASKQSRWTGPLWALAMLTKPFAFGLLPLLMVLAPKGKPSKRHQAILIGLGIVALYLAIQFVQAGHINVGAHEGMNQGNLWQGPQRIILNLAHGLQILFSVHNYYFPNPALTGPGNMLHTSPLLMMLGIFGLFASKQYFPNRRIARALLLGSLIAFGMASLLDHMDHFYMEAGVFLLILASIPVLRAHRIWIPLVLATLHFQAFYFFLQYKPGFQLTGLFFIAPMIVDLCFLGWCLAKPKEMYRLVKEPFSVED